MNLNASTTPVRQSPAQAPVSSAPSEGDGNAWREGDSVVLPLEGGELPDRCVVCNAPADMYRQHVTLTVVPRSVYAALLLHPLLFAALSSAMGRSAPVELGLCEKHRNRRGQGRLTKLVGLVLGALMFGAAAAYQAMWFAAASLLTMLVMLALGERMMRTATLDRVDGRHLWLRVGDEFLHSMAPRPRSMSN